MRRSLPAVVLLGLLLLPSSLGQLPRHAPLREASPGASEVDGARAAGDRATARSPEAPRRLGHRAANPARPATLPAEARDVLARPDPLRPRRLALLTAAGSLQPTKPAFTIADVTHEPVQLRKAGLPVLNRRGRLHHEDGEPLSATLTLDLPPRQEGRWISAAEAAEIAVDATGVRVQRRAPVATRGWWAEPGATVPVWQVAVAGAAPDSAWQVLLDGPSGRVLAAVDRLLHLTGSGDVYDPGPGVTSQVSSVPLEALDGSGLLSGSFVQIHDDENPSAFEPSNEFRFPPADPRFVQTSVYWALSRTALRARGFGFPAFPEPIPAHVARETASGPLNNAFYDPSGPRFVFGNGDGVITANLGTDSDVPAHEMGHHVFETLVEPLIVSSLDPVLAMHEAVADLFSALVNGDPNVGEGTIPGQPYLRTLDNTKRFPDDDEADPHLTGLIYGGAGWEIIQSMGARRFGKALVAGLPYLPIDAEPWDFRQAFFKGAKKTLSRAKYTKYKKRIDRAFDRHGFDATRKAPEFRGYLTTGEPQSRSLKRGRVHFYIFGVPPGATEAIFRTEGSGNVNLWVFNQDFDPDDPSTYEKSELSNSFESVRIHRFSTPNIEDHTSLGVALVGYGSKNRASQYTLEVTTTLGSDDVVVDGAPIEDSLDAPGEIDFMQFSGQAGQIVRMEVESLDPGLDLVAGIVEPLAFDVLAADDDSGPGLDPLLQGVPLPATGQYSVAILAYYDDVDPRFGTGAYRVTLETCDNTGPDPDGDGLVDDCDDDDDGDDFRDAIDSQPDDPNACYDFDQDGCDDCSGGAWDPDADGPDADGDGRCDAGDVDDDDDGCRDEDDPAPITPSVDPDRDFHGADCDNCPDEFNPLQADGDDDGVGDACATCTRVAWTDPPLDPPDQNPADLVVAYRWPTKPGRQGWEASGSFDPGALVWPAGAFPGAHVHLADHLGVLVDVDVPDIVPGTGCHPDDGWTLRLEGVDEIHEYVNVSGAIDPPACTPGSAGHVDVLEIADRRPSGGVASFHVGAWSETFLRKPSTKPQRIVFALGIGTQDTPGETSAASAGGACSEAVLYDGGASLGCKVVKSKSKKKKNRGVKTVTCRR